MGRWRDDITGGARQVLTRAALILVTIILFLNLVGKSYPGNYSFSRIRLPGSAGIFATQAHAIDSTGRVVGDSQAGAVCFLYADGKFSTFKVPFSNAFGTSAWGINDSAEIVGYFTSSTGAHGFLKKAAVFTTIDNPAGTETSAHAINNRGEIVGTFTEGANVHGFLLAKGVFSTIDAPGRRDDIPGYRNTFPYGVNDSGHIVGYVSSFSPGISFSGFLYRGGSFTRIEVPGADETFAQGINNHNQVVGYYKTSGGYRGFLYSNGAFTSIDVPEAKQTLAQGINDAGLIVGSFDRRCPGPC